MTDAHEMLFRHISEHVKLADADKELLRACYKPVHFRKRQYVQKEGDIVRNSNFVTKGCLRSYYRDENGFAHVLMFAVENWWISDLDSYVYQTPSQLFIDALEDTDVLQINREDQEMLFEKIPVLERYNRLIMQRLNYEDAGKGTKISLTYNRAGDYLYAVGTNEGERLDTDIMMQARDQLDLTWRQRINKMFSINAGVQNLLNTPMTMYQDFKRNYRFDPIAVKPPPQTAVTPDGDIIFRKYYPRPYYSLAVNMIF